MLLEYFCFGINGINNVSSGNFRSKLLLYLNTHPEDNCMMQVNPCCYDCCGRINQVLNRVEVSGLQVYAVCKLDNNEILTVFITNNIFSI